jgi:hypothetical protein
MAGFLSSGCGQAPGILSWWRSTSVRLPNPTFPVWRVGSRRTTCRSGGADPSDLERVQAKYLPRIHDEEPTEVLVITLGRRHRRHPAVPPQRLPGLGWHGRRDRAGVRTLRRHRLPHIGERVHLGRGLGTQSIEQFTDRLFADWSDIEEVVVTPQAANRPSCRAFGKAGYALRWTGRLDSDDPADSGVTALYTRRR